MASQNPADGNWHIPIIDINGSGPGSEADIAARLVDAAARYGFVYVRNQGKDIPVDAIDKMFDLSRTFFSSPAKEKEPYKIGKNNRGWSSMHSETLDAKNQRVGDFKEAMNIGEFILDKPQQPLPPYLQANGSKINDFHGYCHKLMLKILTLFAIGLKVEQDAGGSDWFASRHRGRGPSGCTLRLLHYPPIPPGSDYQPSVDIRAGAHSDYGSITLLFQKPGQPGLEIIPPETRTADNNYGSAAAWTPVQVSPPGTEDDPSPPILVNIGDLLSHWTNNLLKSTVHRVVFPKEGKQGGADRYSIAYFGHPISSTVLEPVPSEMVRKLASGRATAQGSFVKAMTADEHLMSRLKATYLGLYKDDKDEQDEATKGASS